MKTLPTTFAITLGAAFISVGMGLAAPASAVPCPDDGGAMEQSCMDCTTAAGSDLNAMRACHGFAPVVNTPSPWADCNAMPDAITRSNCVDQHIMGQR